MLAFCGSGIANLGDSLPVVGYAIRVVEPANRSSGALYPGRLHRREMCVLLTCGLGVLMGGDPLETHSRCRVQAVRCAGRV